MGAVDAADCDVVSKLVDGCDPLVACIEAAVRLVERQRAWEKQAADSIEQTSNHVDVASINAAIAQLPEDVEKLVAGPALLQLNLAMLRMGYLKSRACELPRSTLRSDTPDTDAANGDGDSGFMLGWQDSFVMLRLEHGTSDSRNDTIDNNEFRDSERVRVFCHRLVKSIDRRLESMAVGKRGFGDAAAGGSAGSFPKRPAP